MEFANTYPGGTEVEISMLFADVRGSTSLAETMSAKDFSQLMNRFYKLATKVLIKKDAFIDKFVGDEVIGFFFPLFTGPNHAKAAALAAQEILQVSSDTKRKGPQFPIGVGVHTGVAYVGTVSGAADSIKDITALGDNVNIGARLASLAGAGEALISEAAFAAANLELGELEQRQLELKGKSEPFGVRVLRNK